jgi:hypothetical protein
MALLAYVLMADVYYVCIKKTKLENEAPNMIAPYFSDATEPPRGPNICQNDPGLYMGSNMIITVPPY